MCLCEKQKKTIEALCPALHRQKRCPWRPVQLKLILISTKQLHLPHVLIKTTTSFVFTGSTNEDREKSRPSRKQKVVADGRSCCPFSTMCTLSREVSVGRCPPKLASRAPTKSTAAANGERVGMGTGWRLAIRSCRVVLRGTSIATFISGRKLFIRQKLRLHRPKKHTYIGGHGAKDAVSTTSP
ncbi:unnamed protein product [Ectocarpus sp. 12 AP-2014]